MSQFKATSEIRILHLGRAFLYYILVFNFVKKVREERLERSWLIPQIRALDQLCYSRKNGRRGGSRIHTK